MYGPGPDCNLCQVIKMNEENKRSDDKTGLPPIDRRGLIKQSATGVAGMSLLSGTSVADQKNDGIIVSGDEYDIDLLRPVL